MVAQISVYNGVVTCQEGTGGITTITLATHETINQVRRRVLSLFDPGFDTNWSRQQKTTHVFWSWMCDCF